MKTRPMADAEYELHDSGKNQDQGKDAEHHHPAWGPRGGLGPRR
jgi:hypothetical protein